MARTIPAHILDGRGNPTIVLLNGAGVTLSHWNKVWPELAKLSATFLYDRRPPENVRRFPQEIGGNTVAALRDLLHDIEVKPPFLLVGHSMGGIYANLYARLFPNEVAGIVLVDSSHPHQMRQMQADATWLTQRSLDLTHWLDRRFGPGQFTELVLFDEIAAEIDAAGPFPAIPLTVLTAGKPAPRWAMPEPMRQQHLANQRSLAALSPHGRQVMVQSGHLMPRERPEAIVAAVAGMLGEIRTRGRPREPSGRRALASRSRRSHIRRSGSGS